MKGPEFLQDALSDIDDTLLMDALTERRRPAAGFRFAPIAAVAAAFLILVGVVLPLALGLFREEPYGGHKGPAYSPPTKGPEVLLGHPYVYGDSFVFDISSPTYSLDTAPSFGAHYVDALRAPIVFTENGVDRQIAFDLFGSAVTLHYVESHYFLCGEYTVRRYRIEGDEDAYIELMQDGSLYRLTGYGIFVPQTGEDTRVQLERTLSAMIDLSRYTEFSRDGDRCVWSHTANGYGVNDSLEVTYRNGRIERISSRPQISIPQSTMSLDEINTVVGAHLSAVYEKESDKELDAYTVTRVYYGQLYQETVLYVEVTHTYKTEQGVSNGRPVTLILLD